MLEQAAGAESADPPTPPPDEEPYYTPKDSAGALTGKDKAPSVKRFNPKMLALIGTVGGIVVVGAFWMGLQVPKAKPPAAAESSSKPPMPPVDVNALPGGYDAVVPSLGDPHPGDLGSVGTEVPGSAPDANATPAQHQLTPLEQYAQQAEIERLRNSDRARSAGVSFANAGGNEGPVASAVPAVAAGADQLQERLLDLAARPGGSGAPATSGNLTARDDANRQDDKADFVGKARDTDFTLHASVESPRSPYTLFAGTILPCVLTQGINSDLPGQIGCMISQNVYDTVTGRHLLRPAGDEGDRHLRQPDRLWPGAGPRRVDPALASRWIDALARGDAGNGPIRLRRPHGACEQSLRAAPRRRRLGLLDRRERPNRDRRQQSEPEFCRARGPRGRAKHQRGRPADHPEESEHPADD